MAFNPDIFAWARSAAGLSVDEAAHVLGFRESQQRSAVERLEALESGTEEPSLSVLRKMAKAYRRSLLVFYLSEPPRTGDRGQDFRRAPGTDPQQYDPTLDALIRDIRGRQNIVKDLREQDEGGQVDYIGSANLQIPQAALAARIAKRIQFSLVEFREQSSAERAFAYLRDRVEISGTFVLLLGNLGSYQSNIPSSVFRGYAIADPLAPFIVINDQDSKVAWSFTVLHELTHLWLGASGVSGQTVNTQVESYCNSVAGEILLPSAELDELRLIGGAPLPQAIQAVEQFARERNVSRSMVAYKLLRATLIREARWRELEQHYELEWTAIQERRKAQERKVGGPDYYVVKRHRLGNALLDTVRTSLAEGSITPTRAGQVLGVKPRNVDPLLHLDARQVAR